MRRLINQNDSILVWDVDPETDEITEFHVYESTKEDKKQYREGYKIPPYRHCSFSDGNCCADWKDLKNDELVCRCLRILFDYKVKDYKPILLEIGKIKELESIRRMIFTLYGYSNRFYYEEFVEEIYG